jgi:hypothetical protein
MPVAAAVVSSAELGLALLDWFTTRRHLKAVTEEEREAAEKFVLEHRASSEARTKKADEGFSEAAQKREEAARKAAAEDGKPAPTTGTDKGRGGQDSVELPDMDETEE